jgi:hypothetical protein
MAHDGRPPASDTRETARYIEQLARELRDMAAAADIGFLAYLLGMVEGEAAATVRRLSDDQGG